MKLWQNLVKLFITLKLRSERNLQNIIIHLFEVAV